MLHHTPDGRKGVREETEFRPSRSSKSGGKLILPHIMRSYAHHGFHEFVLCLGYRGNMLREHFLNCEAMNNDFTVSLDPRKQIEHHGAHDEGGVIVTLAGTGLDSMPGKRVKAVQKYVDGDTFMLTYGDGVSDVDLEKLLAFHKNYGKLATVATVRPIAWFGVLELDHSVVSSFNEFLYALDTYREFEVLNDRWNSGQAPWQVWR